MGASTLTMNNTGGTDHLSFDAIGLPGFQFIQDPIEYDTLTHHSNQDNFDRIQEKDMRINATIMASFVYQTAMMDAKIPRKSTNPDTSEQKRRPVWSPFCLCECPFRSIHLPAGFSPASKYIGLNLVGRNSRLSCSKPPRY